MAGALASSLAWAAESKELPPIPTLDEMAGEWMPMKDVAYLPVVHNFHDIVLTKPDLTSFAFNPSYSVTHWSTEERRMYPPVRLFVGAKEWPTAECRWYPYRSLRRNQDCGGLAVETDLRLINEQNAVLCRVKLTNPGKTECKTEMRLETPARLHTDGLTALRSYVDQYDKERKKPWIVAVYPVQKPASVSNEGGKVTWIWPVNVEAGGEMIIEFVAANALEKETDNLVARVQGWGRNFNREFEDFKACWEKRWNDAFTPGNGHFSGNLPRLMTDNAALKRNYYMGIVTLLALERTQYPIHPRSFITSGERPAGIQYFWDASMQANVWALLEPENMKTLMRLWLLYEVRIGTAVALDHIQSPEDGSKNFLKLKHPDKIEGYAFNACVIFQTVLDYMRATGDWAFLDEKLASGKTVLDRMDEIAMDWKGLTLPDSPLANYGENHNLLECAPAYIHRVPSVNAQNVWMMRQAAALHEMRGHQQRAEELRAEAQRLLPAVLALYSPGEGVWNTLHKDGQRVELRHCVDYIYIGNALVEDLTPTMRSEMTQFVQRELLMPTWMRAMSLKDAAAAKSDRPDHGPMGAYDGWPALTAGTMWRLGFASDAFDFYCKTAAVTKEGPFAQAREFYGPRKAERDAPVRVALRGGSMKECVSGVAFSDVVLSTFFGFNPSLDGKALVADPKTPRPFQGTLTGVRWGNQLYQLSADQSGVQIQSAHNVVRASLSREVAGVRPPGEK